MDDFAGYVFGFLLGLILLGLLGMIAYSGGLAYHQGAAKQNILQREYGVEVGWWEAAGYPSEYFQRGEHKVQIEAE